MHTSVAIALCLLVAACAHKPRCDYTRSLGVCSAAIDTIGNQVVVKADQCSEVDVEVAGRLRTIRPSARGQYVSDTETLVDIKACRLFQASAEAQ
jgi:hypothetical protein